MARPLGGPKVELTRPDHLLGTFASTPSYGLLLFGAVLTIGGIAGLGAAVYDLVTGRASMADVGRDIAVFIEGWIAEMVAGVTYDAELEKTHAYALFLLLIPGLLLLWANLIPLLRRGSPFRVEPDGSVMVRRGDSWGPLLEYQYSAAVADGRVIEFVPPADGPPAVVLPQARVFCRENGARLTSELSAEFFTQLLGGRGFEVAATSGAGFAAQRP